MRIACLFKGIRKRWAVCGCSSPRLMLKALTKRISYARVILVVMTKQLIVTISSQWFSLAFFFYWLNDRILLESTLELNRTAENYLLESPVDFDFMLKLLECQLKQIIWWTNFFLICPFEVTSGQKMTFPSWRHTWGFPRIERNINAIFAECCSYFWLRRFGANLGERRENTRKEVSLSKAFDTEFGKPIFHESMLKG